jgi:hypothetical protein
MYPDGATPTSLAFANRRRTDGHQSGVRQPPYRAVAEEAYRRYLEDGRKQDRLLLYWDQAAAVLRERPIDASPLPTSP